MIKIKTNALILVFTLAATQALGQGADLSGVGPTLPQVTIAPLPLPKPGLQGLPSAISGSESTVRVQIERSLGIPQMPGIGMDQGSQDLGLPTQISPPVHPFGVNVPIGIVKSTTKPVFLCSVPDWCSVVQNPETYPSCICPED